MSVLRLVGSLGHSSIPTYPDPGGPSNSRTFDMPNLQNVRIDDTDPSLSYKPEGLWDTQMDPGAYQTTLHFTQTPGASIQLNFNGWFLSLGPTFLLILTMNHHPQGRLSVHMASLMQARHS